jgi:hypothetical protein
MLTLTACLLLIVTAAQGIAGTAVGGVPQPPPRDPRAKPLTGTASIGGRVTAADSGAPIYRAVVTLSGGSAQRAVATDREGRYRFNNLPAGVYSLIAMPASNRAGYQAAAYGAIPAVASIPGGKPIELAEGQRVENIDMALPRTGVITGRVTDTDGEPAARIQVAAFMIRSGQEPSQAGGAQTDDLGQFRLFGLFPGEYIVRASPAPGFSVIRGQLDEDQESTGFAPTYAPGTPVRGEAMRLRVGRGAEVTADIRLVETRMYSISGTAVNSKGEAQPNMSVMLMRSDDIGGGSVGSSVNLNGTFTVRNLPPGQYEVVARHTPPRAPGAVPTGPEPQEFASVQVEITTSNVDGLALMTRPGAVVTGEIVYDDTPPAGARTNLFAEPGLRRSLMGGPYIELKDSTFTMRNVFGPVVLRGSMGAGRNWALASVLLNGNDITDVPTTFTAGDSGHLQVVFTSKAPAVEGLVVDESGKPTMDAMVVLFAQDPSTWPRRSSYLRTTRAIKDGKYAINALREGRYFAVAVPLDIAVSTAEPDAELMATLSKVATAVVLNPGEKRSVDLTLVRVQQ